jgi:hypothetical protein
MNVIDRSKYGARYLKRVVMIIVRIIVSYLPASQAAKSQI